MVAFKERASSESFGTYRKWQKEFLATEMKFPKGTTKLALWAYCSAMAQHGTNGLHCTASDQTIARELGVYHYETVSRYRHLAIDLGWFREVSKEGRSGVLDISIPEDGMNGDETIIIAEEKPKTERERKPKADASNGSRAPKHIEKLGFRDCPACKPHLNERGQVPHEIAEAHYGQKFEPGTFD